MNEWMDDNFELEILNRVNTYFELFICIQEQKKMMMMIMMINKMIGEKTKNELFVFDIHFISSFFTMKYDDNDKNVYHT